MVSWAVLGCVKIEASGAAASNHDTRIKVFSGLASIPNHTYDAVMKRHKKLIIAGCSAIALAASFLFPGQTQGQDAAADDPAAITAILAEITAQQVQLTEGQVALDQRLSVIEENVRVARIYASRGGGGK